MGNVSKQINDPLVWIDAEMTGLDPERDALIEVAVVITDGDLNIVDPGIDVLIKPSEEALAHMNDFVRQMHTSSGLLDELADGVSMDEARRQVMEYIRHFVPTPKKALLAGNSVGTDKSFLVVNMPEVIDHLHYRLIDVSSIKELAKRWHRKAFEESPQKFGGHRALGDIRDSIQELAYYRRALFPAEPVTREQAKQAAAEALALGITSAE